MVLAGADQHGLVGVKPEIGIVLEQLQHHFQENMGGFVRLVPVFLLLECIKVIPCLIEASRQDEGANECNEEVAIGQHFFVWQRAQPADDADAVTFAGPAITADSQYFKKQSRLLCQLGMLQCHFIFVVRKPFTGGGFVQNREAVRKLDTQTVTQEILEQGVIAEPAWVLFDHLDKKPL